MDERIAKEDQYLNKELVCKGCGSNEYHAIVESEYRKKVYCAGCFGFIAWVIMQDEKEAV